MDKPPPKNLPPGHATVPIIGAQKFIPNVIFELAGFKLHPPAGMDHGYVMMMVMMASASSSMFKTIFAFQQPGKPVAQAYLAEDCELGKKHTLIMLGATLNAETGDGELAFHIAKPVEDDPSKKN